MDPVIEDFLKQPTLSGKRGGGLRPEQGRDSSKRNSLKHGQRARSVFPPDMAAAIARRIAELTPLILPVNPYEVTLVGEMAKAIVKVDRCTEMMLLDLQRTIDLAGTVRWDAERDDRAAALAKRLAKDPWRVARALAGTKHGARWLLHHWEGLREVAEGKGSWNEEQRQLAFDMLGVSPVLRDGSMQVPAAADGPALAELAGREVVRLTELLEGELEDLDEAARGMAASGMSLDEDGETRRLRQYEGRARREWRWAVSELKRVRAGCAPSEKMYAAHKDKPGAAPEPAVDETEPVMSAAAADYAMKRSEWGSFLFKMTLREAGLDGAGAAFDEPEPAEAPAAVEEPASAPAVEARDESEVEGESEGEEVAEAPASEPVGVASSSPVAQSRQKGNRRYRREQEKAARKAASRGFKR